MGPVRHARQCRGMGRSITTIRGFYAQVPAQAAGPVLLPSDRRYSYVARGGSWDDPAARLRSAARRGSNEEWNRRDPAEPAEHLVAYRRRVRRISHRPRGRGAGQLERAALDRSPRRAAERSPTGDSTMSTTRRDFLKTATTAAVGRRHRPGRDRLRGPARRRQRRDPHRRHRLRRPRHRRRGRRDLVVAGGDAGRDGRHVRGSPGTRAARASPKSSARRSTSAIARSPGSTPTRR